MKEMKSLMETNVYSVKGKVLIVGSCLFEVFPETYSTFRSMVDEIYTLCLETTHINMAITKLSAIFATGQVEEMIFASVDRSPHCTQMHYIMHEIERTLPNHAPVKHYVVTEEGMVEVSEHAIDLSKSLAKLSKIQ